MIQRVVVLFAIYCLTCSFLAHAEEQSAEERALVAEAELGLLLTEGNTQSAAYKGKIDLKHDMKYWRNNYILEGFYKRDEQTIIRDGVESTEDRVTDEKYFGSVQGDYKLNDEHRGIFGYLSYEEDKFSGYQHQGTVAAGYSDRMFNTKKQRLDFSVGPGMAYSKTEPSEDEDGNYIAAETDEAFILRVSGDYVFKFSEKAKFTQKLSSDIALDTDKNTKTRSETAVTAALNGSFAIRASYTIQHNSVVSSDDIEKTDTRTALTLVYTY